MPSIYCSVNNCHYWKDGNVCDAREIMVCADSVGAEEPDTFDAVDHVQFEQTPVDSCMETCCKTFVERGSGDEKEDGITRS